MKKLTVLSLVLLLAVGIFVAGCKKKAATYDKDKKTEVKTLAEKATEPPVEKNSNQSVVK